MNINLESPTRHILDANYECIGYEIDPPILTIDGMQISEEEALLLRDRVNSFLKKKSKYPQTVKEYFKDKE